MKFKLFDTSKESPRYLGICTLDEGVMPSELFRLQQAGWLQFQAQRDREDQKVFDAEQAKNAARLAEQARRATEDDVKASKLPDGNYELESLRPKQLKALCQQLGLKDYGNAETLLDRLKEHRRAQEQAAESAAKAKPDGQEVDLDTLSVKELKEIARGYGVSEKGNKEAIIERIIAAAEAKAAEEAEGEEGEDEGEEQTDQSDGTDREEGEDTTEDTAPTPPQAGGENTAETAVPHSADDSSEGGTS